MSSEATDEGSHSHGQGWGIGIRWILCPELAGHLSELSTLFLVSHRELTLLRDSSPSICSLPTHPSSSTKANQSFRISRLRISGFVGYKQPTSGHYPTRQ